MKPRARAWEPCPVTKETLPVHAALKALRAGTADSYQQELALDWVLYMASAMTEPAFRSDQDGGERETSFALGRQYVGQQIMKMINLPSEIVEQLRNGDRTGTRDPDKHERRTPS